MTKFLRLLAAASAVAAVWTTSALAVQGGAPDGNDHPYVGMSEFYDAAGNPLWICSGTLISPTTYVTAGHCAGPEYPGAPQPASAKVWFDSDTPVTGTPVADPGWTGELPGHDLGIVRLTTPVTTLGYAKLPPPGYLDDLAGKRGQQDTTMTIVGYGVQEQTPKLQIATFERTVGTVQLVGVTDLDLLTTASPGQGTGGAAACYGDSGGPVFNGGYLVATTSFGSKWCTGRSGSFRLDTAAAQSFLAAG